AGILPNPLPILEVWPEFFCRNQLLDAIAQFLEVWAAPALGEQKSARLEGAIENAKEPLMVFDPMKYSGTEDQIERVGERKIEKITLLHGHAVAEFLKSVAGLPHHVF